MAFWSTIVDVIVICMGDEGTLLQLYFFLGSEELEASNLILPKLISK